MLTNLFNPALLLRGAVFVVLVGALALAETLWPRRPFRIPRLRRWLNNGGLALVNGLAQSLLLPLTGAGIAALAGAWGIGLFNFVALPETLEIILSVALLDLTLYTQHVLFHRVPLLKRFHRVHHTDLDLDFTSGLRFHFGEGLISALIKMAVIVILGASPSAVLTFEVFLAITAAFSHSNIYLPESFDRWLRYLLVTPDMHRVHHSIVPHETLSNYGFGIPWWDHLFKTYRAQPAAGHREMQIGLAAYQDAKWSELPVMLVLPFRGP